MHRRTLFLPLLGLIAACTAQPDTPAVLPGMPGPGDRFPASASPAALAAGQARLYTVGKATIDAAAAAALAKKLGLEGPATQDADGALVVAAGARTLVGDPQQGVWEYRDTSTEPTPATPRPDGAAAGPAPAAPAAVPDEAEARRIAEGRLAAWNLTGGDAAVFYEAGVQSMSSSATPGVTTVTQRQLMFVRQLDGKPVRAPGCTVSVTIGPGGGVMAMRLDWAPVTAGQVVAVKTEAEAKAAVPARVAYLNGLSTPQRQITGFQPTEATLTYVVNLSDTSKIGPVWVMKGDATIGTTPQAYQLQVTATDAFPAPDPPMPRGPITP